MRNRSAILSRPEAMKRGAIGDTTEIRKNGALLQASSIDSALTPAGVQQNGKEPERRIGQRGCESLVISLSCLGQAPFGVFGGTYALQALPPPARPHAAAAHHFGTRLVANIL